MGELDTTMEVDIRSKTLYDIVRSRIRMYRVGLSPRNIPDYIEDTALITMQSNIYAKIDTTMECEVTA